MIKKTFFLVSIMLSTSLSGCILFEQDDESNLSDNCVILEPGHEDDGVLRIVSYDILALTDSVIQEFTNQTGYEVDIDKKGDAGSILDQLMLTKNAQQSDLMLGLDNSYLQTAIENCLLRETLFTQSEQYQNIQDSAKESYSGNLAIPFDQGSVCLNYDEDYVDGENVSVPSSLWDLTKPEWEGKFAVPSPLSSSPGRSFMIATIDYFENDDNDSTDAFDWWQAVRENNAIITSGWTEAYETHYTGGYGEYTTGHIGDAHITVSYCHSPGVEAFFSENYTHSTSLTIPLTTFHQVEYAGIINGAANIPAAELFLEYLLSEEVNALMPENNYMYSVLNGQDLPETDGYRYHADYPEKNSDIDIERINNEMQSWLEQWQEATQ